MEGLSLRRAGQLSISLASFSPVLLRLRLRVRCGSRPRPQELRLGKPRSPPRPTVACGRGLGRCSFTFAGFNPGLSTWAPG